MPIPQRLHQYVSTEKQRRLPKDFLTGWQDYEKFWENATVGQSGPGQRVFTITAGASGWPERCLRRNRPSDDRRRYAAEHSPTGEVLQHPIFVTAIAFYSLGKPVSAPGSEPGCSQSSARHRGVFRAVSGW